MTRNWTAELQALSVVACDVTEDSRSVRPGAIFVARPGDVFDGRAFIPAAESAGAVAVLTDTQGAAACNGPVLTSEQLTRDAAMLAHHVHGDPTAALEVVGITGTNGKSTCALLLQHVLRATDGKAGLVGGVHLDDGHARTTATLTTPPATDLASIFAAIVRNGCMAAAMEVSSQAIATNRIHGTRFAAGVFTNFSGDHLDLHGDMDTYRHLKTDWIEAIEGPRVVNTDDAVGATIAGDVITVGREGLVQCTMAHADLRGLRIAIESPWGAAMVEVPLVGEHNMMNAAEVIAAACALGRPFDAVCGALMTAPVPRGRLEPLQQSGTGPLVFVDFAHPDGALDTVLASVAAVKHVSGRLAVVFGCGGDRDVTKRPRMAAVACAHADAVWLTSDNPRREDHEQILDQMQAGVPGGTSVQVHREVNRAAAIEQAIAWAGVDDVVVIAGKGHERVQLVGDEARPFDDAAVARAALQA